jgi:hypothetical protein
MTIIIIGSIYIIIGGYLVYLLNMEYKAVYEDANYPLPVLIGALLLWPIVLFADWKEKSEYEKKNVQRSG